MRRTGVDGTQSGGMDREAGEFGLRLLATTDLHAHVMAYDYAWDRPLATGGLVRLAPLIAAARAGVAEGACLLLDNGDSLQGSLLGERLRLGGRGPMAGLHPVIAAMNALGYDAATLGNHDLGFGPALIARFAEGARFPIVVANLVRARGATVDDDRPFLPPTALIERRLTAADGREATIRVGVVGLLPPQVLMWERQAINRQLEVRPIAEAAGAWARRLRAAGADLVVALCHSGIETGAPVAGEAENAARAVAALPEVDVVVAGHTHGTFPGPGWPAAAGIDAAAGTLAGKPAVMAGFWGSHLGQIDLVLARGAGGWRVTGHRTRLIPAGRGRPAGGAGAGVGAGALAALVRPAHRATLAEARRPIGATARPLSSYLAPLGPTAALALLHRVQRDWLDAMVEGTALAALPRLSAASALKSGGRGGPLHYTDIPAGPVARRHMADLCPFPNRLSVLRLTGAAVRDWLERSAALYARIRPGQPGQTLLDPAMPGYSFDTIAGLTYRIDPTAPALFAPDGARLAGGGPGRVRDLRWQGRPVAAEEAFLVVTNSYRASGGGGYSEVGLGAPALVHESPVSMRDLLTRHFAREEATGGSGSRPLPPVAPFWSLELPPATPVVFDTGPGALAGLGGGAAMAGLVLSAQGVTEAGFLRLSVTARGPAEALPCPTESARMAGG